MSFANMIPEFEQISDALRINGLNDKDIGENLVQNLNCKYYTFEEFSKIKASPVSFNIFHCNVNGYECHFDSIHEVLANIIIDFQVICFSETCLKLDQDFSPNYMLQGYHNPFNTATKSRNGGVSIFTKDTFVTIERDDLKTCQAEFESVWIEIKQKKVKILSLVVFIDTHIIPTLMTLYLTWILHLIN